MKRCVCCGARQSTNIKYFILSSGRRSRVTRDHILLKSLGGASDNTNLNYMCHHCNQLRGNLFAEQKEFMDWFKSGEPLPEKKNFSYIHEGRIESLKLRLAKRTEKHQHLKQELSPEECAERNKQRQERRERAKEKCRLNALNATRLPSKEQSTFVRVVRRGVAVYHVYKHPIYGESEVRVSDETLD